MAFTLYPLARQSFLNGNISWTTGTIKVSLVRGYTYSAAHQYLSDITGSGGGTLVATQTLGSKTSANGVAGATTTTDWPAVASGAAIPAYVVYMSSAVGGGADLAAGAQQLIGYYDGIELVTCALAAASGATSIAVDPLPIALALGATVVFGGVTATLTAAAAAGARALAVSATSGTIAQGVVGTSSAQGGWPVTPSGVDIIVTWDPGPNQIFKL